MQILAAECKTVLRSFNRFVMNCQTPFDPKRLPSSFIIRQALSENEVSNHSEWKGRKYRQKKILPARRVGVGGCCLPIRPSVYPSVTMTLLNNFRTN
jgi:hypothetical protein